jgi:hypothetical protein
VRYTLLSLFHTGSLATAEDKALLPDSIPKIRDQAEDEYLRHGIARHGRRIRWL